MTSLKEGPHTVGLSFGCSWNKLVSLKYAPEYVGESFYCEKNPLTDYSLNFFVKNEICITLSKEVYNLCFSGDSLKSEKVLLPFHEFLEKLNPYLLEKKLSEELKNKENTLKKAKL